MNAVLSLLVLAVLLLPVLAWSLWRRGARQQAVLMLVLTFVAAINVAIWTWPDAAGTAPAGQLPQ
ncbi:hypothetical protein [Novosphingobium sp.]|uniref:hypothetical protein n=1 Tax=Novosphingobium sp. TaxID=1874826 RepID=UPI0027322FB7|nr:hypothetical protein [Novosphingobium sp.]MDP3906940.1 hypothetical protein [Novosphingobium sp.]